MCVTAFVVNFLAFVLESPFGPACDNRRVLINSYSHVFSCKWLCPTELRIGRAACIFDFTSLITDGAVARSNNKVVGEKSIQRGGISFINGVGPPLIQFEGVVARLWPAVWCLASLLALEPPRPPAKGRKSISKVFSSPHESPVSCKRVSHTNPTSSHQLLCAPIIMIEPPQNPSKLNLSPTRFSPGSAAQPKSRKTPAVASVVIFEKAN